MTMRIALLLLSLVICPAVFAEELVEVESPRGTVQRFLLIEPDEPRAAVILFAGGKGALGLKKSLFGAPAMNWGKKNFLVRTRQDFAAHGLVVATVDAPSDQQDKDGMSGGFRSSAAHVQDIEAVIAWLREKADLPVWLVGTSRGTESASNVTINAKQKPDGLVLTSSMTVGDRNGRAVTDFDLAGVTVPTLIVHHRDDACSKTRPEHVADISDALSRAPVVEVALFSGGRAESDPCRAMSHHGYLGIEREVVDAIAAFILANSGG